MIEQVIELELELRFRSLSETEGLEDRSVGVEEPRPAELAHAAAAVSKSVESGRLPPGPACSSETTGGLDRAIGSLEPIAVLCWIARSRTILDAAFHISDAGTLVNGLCAAVKPRRPRQPALETRS